MKNSEILLYFVIGIVMLALVQYIVPLFAVVAVDDRKSFGFCPKVGDYLPTVKYTNGNVVTYNIESCPSIRVYVNNWSLISTVDQQAILTKMATFGFYAEN